MLDNTCTSSHSGGGDTAHITPQVPKSGTYLRNLHQEHLARRQRLGALSPAMKPEPAPPVPVVEPEICKPVHIAPAWAIPALVEFEMPVPVTPMISHIVRVVARHYERHVNDLYGTRRSAHIVRPRQVAMYLARTLTRHGMPEIGRRMGGRDHTTVLHAFRKITTLLQVDPDLAETVDAIQAELQI